MICFYTLYIYLKDLDKAIIKWGDCEDFPDRTFRDLYNELRKDGVSVDKIRKVIAIINIDEFLSVKGNVTDSFVYNFTKFIVEEGLQ